MRLADMINNKMYEKKNGPSTNDVCKRSDALTSKS